MTAVGEAFLKGFGLPDPETAPGVRFTERGYQRIWELLLMEGVRPGWFRDGFLYLFGEGLEELRPCVDAWSFLVPPCDDRIVFGRNAYGALLVVDNANDTEGAQRVYVLDPFTVGYHGDPRMRFLNVVGNWLPTGGLHWFLDDGAYRAWMADNGVDRLGVDDVLGVKIPKGLGGELESSNLQLDGMIEYYESTAPIYAEAFAKLGHEPGRH